MYSYKHLSLHHVVLSKLFVVVMAADKFYCIISLYVLCTILYLMHVVTYC
jgi:hypothetical protein